MRNNFRFLYKTREIRPTEASYSNNGIEEDGDISNDMHDDTITNDENADDTDTETVVEASEVPQNLSTPKINRKRKKSNIDDKVSMFIDATLKRQKVKEETNTKENVDDDMAFFSSLLPTVKSLTNDDKLQFRIDVLQLLRKYKAKPQRTANIHQPPFSSPGNDYSHDNNNYAYSSQRTYMELGFRPSSSSTGSYFSENSSE
ncbi:unnamed protein product [Phaedon cochleariae]|uniref:BESS domain-containing protein n=1 Tax=Phaedon cochleariae TaxID=80249 RepID=A0A9N9SHL4_PHACE|nr:unnamed protein product [Phaedon cochleariae]